MNIHHDINVVKINLDINVCDVEAQMSDRAVGGQLEKLQEYDQIVLG